MLTVMTGGTRGLGRDAAARIVRADQAMSGKSEMRHIVGVRTAGAAVEGWTALPLDPNSLDSVRAFVASLPDGPIARLILNAGGQRPDASTRTQDGFETTFGSNHLAHYLLLRLLMPRLAPGARIVITSSGTHDPAEKTGVPPPRHADAQKLAFPEQDEALDASPIAAGMRAYSASKLCNLLTAKALAQSATAQDQNWQVFAYDPGLTPGTGLARDQPWVVRHLIWPLLPLFVPFAKTMNRLSDAGRGLSDLATVTSPPTGRIYAALRKGKLTWPDPSTLAQDEGVMQKLWADSAALVQLPD